MISNFIFSRKKMINTCKGIIGVSKAISTTINNSYHTSKAIAIYTPIAEFDKSNVLTINDNYILYLGRIEEVVKNLSGGVDGTRTRNHWRDRPGF